MSVQDRRQFVKLCECGCGEPTMLAAHASRGDGYTKGQPVRFLVGHARRRPAADRFFEKVDAMGVCWEWEGACKSHGYGNFAPVRSRTMLAHRWAWEYLIGPIPPGMELDHRCQNRRCVCPDHLEVVSPKVNVHRSQSQSALNARKTHCKYGHEFSPENTRINGKGDRVCQQCVIQRRSVYLERKRAALAAAEAA